MAYRGLRRPDGLEGDGVLLGSLPGIFARMTGWQVADWQRIVSSELVPLSLTNSDTGCTDQIRMNALFQHVSSLKIGALRTQGITVARNNTSATMFGGGYLKLLFVIRGQSSLHQDGRDVMLKPGTWSVYDPSRTYLLNAPGEADMVAVMMQARDVDAWRRFMRIGATAAHEIRGNALIALHAAVLCLCGEAGDELAERAGLAESFVTLMESAARAHSGGRATEVPPPHNSLLTRARHAVQARCAAPDFGVDALARELGVSRRTLYLALKGEGITPQRLIVQCRLEACRRAMADPAQRNKSLTQIALAAGFAETTHFSRLFKSYFGMTPGAYRNGGTLSGRQDLES